MKTDKKVMYRLKLSIVLCISFIMLWFNPISFYTMDYEFMKLLGVGVMVLLSIRELLEVFLPVTIVVWLFPIHLFINIKNKGE